MVFVFEGQVFFDSINKAREYWCSNRPIVCNPNKSLCEGCKLWSKINGTELKCIQFCDTYPEKAAHIMNCKIVEE